jgi:RNA polymerase sigma factor (TIGR02999 family)
MADGSRPMQSPQHADARRAALDQMWSLVQGELRRVAHRKLALERPGHMLSTTALVHETYLRLAAQRLVSWEAKAQFFALSAREMRRILVDYARRHRHLRDVVRYDSSDGATTDESGGAMRLAGAERADELLALDDALEQLAETDERLSRVVECRFFAGYSEEETAEILAITARTVRRDWTKAKAFLYRLLHEQ